jgi:hypothetical protein
MRAVKRINPAAEKMAWNEKLKKEIPTGWGINKLNLDFWFVKGRIPSRPFPTSVNDEYVEYLTIDSLIGNNSEYCLKNVPIVYGEVE